MTGQEENIPERGTQGEREEELGQRARPGERSGGPSGSGGPRKAGSGDPAAAAFTSRGSGRRRPQGVAHASPGCFSKVGLGRVTCSHSRVENQDVAPVSSPGARAASSGRPPPSLSTFTPTPGVGPRVSVTVSSSPRRPSAGGSGSRGQHGSRLSPDHELRGSVSPPGSARPLPRWPLLPPHRPGVPGGHAHARAYHRAWHSPGAR